MPLVTVHTGAGELCVIVEEDSLNPSRSEWSFGGRLGDTMGRHPWHPEIAGNLRPKMAGPPRNGISALNTFSRYGIRIVMIQLCQDCACKLFR